MSAGHRHRDVLERSGLRTLVSKSVNLWTVIQQDIERHTGCVTTIDARAAVGGGCINQAFQVQGDGQDFFVKINSACLLDMFEAEAEGLDEIVNSETVRAPKPICWGSTEDTAYLVQEYFTFGGRGSSTLLGEQLAAMHRVEREQFGWHRDNTIGATPQVNTWSDDWIDFWRKHRLEFQFALAASNGYNGQLQRKGEQLLGHFPALFAAYSPAASLLHGDLWAGNHATLHTGEPVIFDPALYYGDREADLAMTELFGGFGREFYAAYRDTYPMDSGYSVRKTLYNLYHILNHLNLFGSGYYSQAANMTAQLLSELR